MRDTLPADEIHGLSVCRVGIHGLSPLSDRTLLEVAETAGRIENPSVNKGGTA